jgi:hypothetical protein
LGVVGWGLGVWGIGPNPQSPIPNPQSPIPIEMKIKIYFKKKHLFKYLYNIKNIE